MKKQDFLNDVMAEIQSLKANATAQEINNLELNYLNPEEA